jgi:hypothetical protein
MGSWRFVSTGKALDYIECVCDVSVGILAVLPAVWNQIPIVCIPTNAGLRSHQGHSVVVVAVYDTCVLSSRNMILHTHALILVSSPLLFFVSCRFLSEGAHSTGNDSLLFLPLVSFTTVLLVTISTTGWIPRSLERMENQSL